ncbi:hypothetical protein EON65_59135, partial [archaeon]
MIFSQFSGSSCSSESALMNSTLYLGVSQVQAENSSVIYDVVFSCQSGLETAPIPANQSFAVYM